MKYDSIQYLKSQLINHVDDEMFNRAAYFNDSQVEELAEKRISNIKEFFKKFEIVPGSIEVDKNNIKFKIMFLQNFSEVVVSSSTDLLDEDIRILGTDHSILPASGKKRMVSVYISTDGVFKTKVNISYENQFESNCRDGLYTGIIYQNKNELDISYYDQEAVKNLKVFFDLKGAKLLSQDKESLAQLGFSPDKEFSYKFGEYTNEIELLYWLLNECDIDEFIKHLNEKNITR